MFLVEYLIKNYTRWLRHWLEIHEKIRTDYVYETSVMNNIASCRTKAMMFSSDSEHMLRYHCLFGPICDISNR